MSEISLEEIRKAAEHINKPEVQAEMWASIQKKWDITHEEYKRKRMAMRPTRKQMTTVCDLGLYD